MKSTDSSICSDVIAKTVFCGIVCITCFLSAHAADGDTDTEAVVRPVTAAYTVEAGTSHLADTYLTPLKYSGWSMGLGYERMQIKGGNRSYGESCPQCRHVVWRSGFFMGDDVQMA